MAKAGGGAINWTLWYDCGMMLVWMGRFIRDAHPGIGPSFVR